jgi:hypothetical protein
LVIGLLLPPRSPMGWFAFVILMTRGTILLPESWYGHYSFWFWILWGYFNFYCSGLLLQKSDWSSLEYILLRTKLLHCRHQQNPLTSADDKSKIHVDRNVYAERWIQMSRLLFNTFESYSTQCVE